VRPTADEIRQAFHAVGSDATALLDRLFDEKTFIETGAYTKRNRYAGSTATRAEELEGVITGYGAVHGALVYAFVQDLSRMGGAVDDNHAKKITALYELALANGAPVVGILNSRGADVFEGASTLSAYGKIIRAVTAASGAIPQIALVSGTCTGTLASIAALFDLTVTTKDAQLYVQAPLFTGVSDNETVAFSGDESEALSFVRSLLSYLPSGGAHAIAVKPCTDSVHRLTTAALSGGMRALVSNIADNGQLMELYRDASSAVTALSYIGGVRCGVVGTDASVDEGRIDAAAARKIARFVSFCDAFSIPVLTLVDSMGAALDTQPNFSAALARLAAAYASASVPTISVVVGHAIGCAYILLGSKAVGADLSYVLDTAEIGVLPAESAVAFAWESRITPTHSREALQDEWRQGPSSALAAASCGEVDDILALPELRARICSALLMLAQKGEARARRHSVLPL